MGPAVGIMGSIDPTVTSSQWVTDEIELRVFQLGLTVAIRGCQLVIGTHPGLAYAAAQGAKVIGGRVVGVTQRAPHQPSPGERVPRYRLGAQAFDDIVCAGQGLTGRAVQMARSSDMLVAVGDRPGTLSEFAVAYTSGKVIGVLQGTGSIAEAVEQLVEPFDRRTRAAVLYDEDPVRLIDRLLEHYRTRCAGTHQVERTRQQPQPSRAHRPVTHRPVSTTPASATVCMSPSSTWACQPAQLAGTAVLAAPIGR